MALERAAVLSTRADVLLPTAFFGPFLATYVLAKVVIKVRCVCTQGCCSSSGACLRACAFADANVRAHLSALPAMQKRAAAKARAKEALAAAAAEAAANGRDGDGSGTGGGGGERQQQRKQQGAPAPQQLRHGVLARGGGRRSFVRSASLVRAGAARRARACGGGRP